LEVSKSSNVVDSSSTDGSHAAKVPDASNSVDSEHISDAFKISEVPNSVDARNTDVSQVSVSSNTSEVVESSKVTDSS
jgi:hypothetical protein